MNVLAEKNKLMVSPALISPHSKSSMPTASLSKCQPIRCSRGRGLLETIYGWLFLAIAHSAFGLNVWIVGMPNSGYLEEGQDLTISLGASDTTKVEWVNFKLDGITKKGTKNGPFTHSFSAADLTSGVHQVTLGVKDTSENWQAVSADIEVIEGKYAIRVDRSNNTYRVGEDIQVELVSTQPQQVDFVQFYFQGGTWVTTSDHPFSITYPTDSLSPGTNVLMAGVKENGANGNYTTIQLEIIILPRPLTFEIKDIQLERQYKTGENVLLELDVSDALRVQKVEFKLNYILKFSDTTHPYRYVYKASDLPTGAHTVSCHVYDKNGNEVGFDETNIYISERGQYGFWPAYNHQDPDDLSDIKSQKWTGDWNRKDGWDWSLPSEVTPSGKSLMGLQRRFNLNQPFDELELQFPCRAASVLWCSWKELEPKKDDFKLGALENRIWQMKKLNNNKGKVVLRLLTSSYKRNEIVSLGDAPGWLKTAGATLLPPEGNMHNFNPLNQIFHDRYKKLIRKIGRTNIPNLVDAAYIGYASQSYGDEGIGPEEGSSATVQKVKERLNVWGDAFSGKEQKVFMGGYHQHGIDKKGIF